MVPEGWSKTTTGASSRSYVPGRNKPKSFSGDIPWVTTPQIGGKYIPAEDHELFVSEEAVREAGGKIIPTGCVIFSCVGELGIVTQNRVPVVINQQLHAFETDERTCAAFFAYQLERAKPAMSALASSTTIPYLNKANCEALPILLPPLPEQRKIADILSTWDQAIETTEALLANARTQKRALMQQLLTGKRRFPAFAGQPWKEVRLGDVADVIVSNVDKKSLADEQPVRLCNYTDVYKRDRIDPSQDFMAATAKTAQIKKFGLRQCDVIITKDSETASDIAMPTYVEDTAADLVCGYHLAIVRPGPDVVGRFLKFFFDLPHTRHYFGTRANGAIRFGLTIDGIEGALINLPSIEEQERIAVVIADAEDAITDLIAEIVKLRTEKKALMQQLLTGKRRVAVR